MNTTKSNPFVHRFAFCPECLRAWSMNTGNYLAELPDNRVSPLEHELCRECRIPYPIQPRGPQFHSVLIVASALTALAIAGLFLMIWAINR